MNEGQKFSLLYLDRSKTLKDSQRFRNRLAAFFQNFLRNYGTQIIEAIRLEIGAEIPVGRTGYGYNVSDFFKKAELKDILDSITVLYNTIIRYGSSMLAEKWKGFVQKAISEENLGYQLDNKCGVHYFVDEEFERNRFSTLSVLENPRYNASRAAYNMAYQYLDNDPIDTKGALRSIFESIEILVKQMVDTKNLNGWIIENKLKEKCLGVYIDDETAKKVTSQMFDGFTEWVDAIHNYRHGQSDMEPVAAPVDVAIYIISSGTSFLRWLIQINNKLEKNIRS
jgi:hypothetical protein